MDNVISEKYKKKGVNMSFLGKEITEIRNFLGRNLLWVGISLVLLYSFVFANDIIWTIKYIILGEAMALGLSSLALYIFTNLNFLKILKSDKADLADKIGAWFLIGVIFLGVHFVVGTSMYGIYLAAK